MSHKFHSTGKAVCLLLMFVLCVMAAGLSGCAQKGAAEEERLVNYWNNRLVTPDDLSPESEYTGVYPLRDENRNTIAKITLPNGFYAFRPAPEYIDNNPTGWADSGAVYLVGDKASDDSPYCPDVLLQLWNDHLFLQQSDEYCTDVESYLQDQYEALEERISDSGRTIDPSPIEWHEYEESGFSCRYFSVIVELTHDNIDQYELSSALSETDIIDYQGRIAWLKYYLGAVIAPNGCILFETEAQKQPDEAPEYSADIAPEQIRDIIKCIRFVN